MIPIKKGREPRSLATYKKTAGACYDAYPNKPDLRAALVTEQGHICCYCMSRIEPTEVGMKIEHWQCQSNFQARQLDYRNLLGACLGGQGQSPRLQHCDTKKGNQTLSRNPADRKDDIRRLIQYNFADGSISSIDPVLDTEIKTVLNLNIEQLCRNRVSTLDAFQKRLPKIGSLDADQWQKYLDDWRDKGGHLEPFVGIVEAYVLKKIHSLGAP